MERVLKVMGHNFRNSYESAIDSYGNLGKMITTTRWLPAEQHG
jgi:hypothetical protein